MAEKTFTVEITAPDRNVFTSTEVVSIIIPSTEGFMGILANHAPIIAGVTLGTVTIRSSDNSTLKIAISGGFTEVMDNKVLILAETAEREDEIDIRRAEQARENALRLLQRHEGTDIDKAQIALQKALLRLNIAKHRRS